ncbi:type 4a pilus biogenesis protein PilO [Kineococcus terrestris]|uniref:type 4a pilus biogenesis protein PilO n=1 Tax=Kineococcus terrestris TaxID=2044856 RepID=UPI0034DB1B33
MSGSRNTAWIAGTGVLALLALVATYFLLVTPKRAEAADVRAQTAGVVASNAQIAQQTELLKSQFATLDEQRARLAEIKASLPDEAEVPALLRQLEGYATSAGVTLVAVTPSPASLYTTTSGAGTDTAGIVQVPLVVQVAGSFPASELFVKNVQADMTRFFGVEQVTVTQGADTADGDDVTTTITGRVFVLDPDVAAAVAAVPTDTQATADDAATTESVS